MTWQQYRRSNLAEMIPWSLELPEGFMSSVSISAPDKANGSPKPGDMIARNPENHADKWLVAKAYFEANFVHDSLSCVHGIPLASKCPTCIVVETSGNPPPVPMPAPALSPEAEVRALLEPAAAKIPAFEAAKYTSNAISLRRIADALERFGEPDSAGRTGFDALSHAIWQGIVEAKTQ